MKRSINFLLAGFFAIAILLYLIIDKLLHACGLFYN